MSHAEKMATSTRPTAASCSATLQEAYQGCIASQRDSKRPGSQLVPIQTQPKRPCLLRSRHSCLFYLQVVSQQPE